MAIIESLILKGFSIYLGLTQYGFLDKFVQLLPIFLVSDGQKLLYILKQHKQMAIFNQKRNGLLLC